jgi:hypothetical protein
LKALRRRSSDLASGKVSSVAPKLWEMTSPSRWSTTKFSASTISGKPWTPSVSETGVSTSRMLAPGAMECAHWRSRLVSSGQPAMSGSVGSKAGTLPAGWMILRLGGSGRPKSWSKVRRSCTAVGEPKASTITIVRLRPSRPFL